MMVAVVMVMVGAVAPVKMVVPDFTLVGVDAALGQVFQERFLGTLASPELQVSTSRDVQQVLGLERQRQLIGCSNGDASCTAELVGALGVDVLLTGSIAKSDSGFIVSLRVIRAGDAQALFTPSTRVATEGALLDWLDSTAVALRAQLLSTLRNYAEPAPKAESPGLVRWIPAMVGGVAIAAGAVCFGVAGSNYLRLTGNSPPPLEEISQVRTTGERLIPVGAVLAGVGAAAVITSFVLSSTAPKAVNAAVVPIPGGAVLSVGATFP